MSGVLRRFTEDVTELVRVETADWMLEFRGGGVPLGVRVAHGGAGGGRSRPCRPGGFRRRRTGRGRTCRGSGRRRHGEGAPPGARGTARPATACPHPAYNRYWHPSRRTGYGTGPLEGAACAHPCRPKRHDCPQAGRASRGAGNYATGHRVPAPGVQQVLAPQSPYGVWHRPAGGCRLRPPVPPQTARLPAGWARLQGRGELRERPRRAHTRRATAPGTPVAAPGVRQSRAESHALRCPARDVALGADEVLADSSGQVRQEAGRQRVPGRAPVRVGVLDLLVRIRARAGLDGVEGRRMPVQVQPAQPSARVARFSSL